MFKHVQEDIPITHLARSWVQLVRWERREEWWWQGSEPRLRQDSRRARWTSGSRMAWASGPVWRVPQWEDTPPWEGRNRGPSRPSTWPCTAAAGTPTLRERRANRCYSMRNSFPRGNGIHLLNKSSGASGADWKHFLLTMSRANRTNAAE